MPSLVNEVEVSKDGILLLKAQSARSQEQNRAIAMARLEGKAWRHR